MPRSKRPIRIEDLFRLRIPGAISLAPDGETIAFALRRSDLKENRTTAHLFLLPWRGGRLRPLTRGAQIDSEPCWSPDGKQLAYISRREGEPPQIWILPLAGGTPWALTHLAGGPIRQLRWSPRGNELLFGHRPDPQLDPEQRRRRPSYRQITRLRHKLDGEGFWPPERWHLWSVAFPSGRLRPLTRGEHDDEEGVWSPDGRQIAFVSNRRRDADRSPDNADLFVVAASGRGLRQLTERYGPVAAPAWSRDGRQLYFMGHFGKRGRYLHHPIHLYRLPLTGGRPTDLTPTLDQWPFNFVLSDTARSNARFILPYREPSPEGRERLAFPVNERGACRLYSVPADGGPLRVEFGGAVNVLAAALRPADGRVAIAAARIMDCGEVYVATADGRQRARRRTRLNRDVFAGLALTEPEETVFRGRRHGGVPVHGWILKPPGFRPTRRYPLLLNIHGGPMAQYGYTFFHEMHYLAAQGYVVVCPNPRGSSGYGLRFMNCIEARWGTHDYDDLMTVVDRMVRRPYVDGRRLGVTGGSYGGFMTTWIVGHTRRFRAAVTQRQVGNELFQTATSDLGFYRAYTRRALPWKEPLKFLRASPNFYAERIRTPLLIIHSDQDLRCPIGQAEELFTFLKLQGRVVEMIRFAGESHGLSRGGRPQNRRERLRRIAAWFARHL